LPDYAAVAGDLRRIIADRQLIGKDRVMLEAFAAQMETMNKLEQVPDLKGMQSDRLRYLKRRIKQAKQAGRKKYRNIPIALWAAAISKREKELGTGTRGGRPPEAI
jgi:hypothetical protein